MVAERRRAPAHHFHLRGLRHGRGLGAGVPVSRRPGLARHAPAPALGAAQLPGDRAPALPDGVHPPGDAPVLHRERQRSGAVFAPATQPGLPARQGGLRQAALRHPARRAGRRLRVDQPQHRADAARFTRLSRRHRRRWPHLVHVALQREHLQHLGDELRRVVVQRHPGAQPGRQDGRLRARHRRGLDQRAPPRARRRPGVGDRQRLLRLPQCRRQLQRRALRRKRHRAAGEDDRAQAEPRRQARPWGRVAWPQGDT